MRDIAKLLAGLIVLLVLVLSVLRPLVRGLLGSPRPAQQPKLAGPEPVALPAGQAAFRRRSTTKVRSRRRARS